MKKVLVTGGAGFIGASFIRFLLKNSDDITVYNIDKLTYAGDTKRLKEAESDKRYNFINDDICNSNLIKDMFSQGIDSVVHFAAESHVDRSIKDAFPFEGTNVRGTLTLLDISREYGIDRFIHISTDEVYGEIKRGQFSEDMPLNPNNPYSASKAAGELFVKSYMHTYGLPVVIIRPSNNYGPWQYPEKLIPVVIINAMNNNSVPVYAQGMNVREWLYVEDCADAVFQIMKNGSTGEIYNVGSGQESMNIDVVKKILAILGKPESLITYVKDRPGHDFRYRMNSEKIEQKLGWKPRTSFDDGLEKTVKWYLENEAWWKKFTP